MSSVRKAIYLLLIGVEDIVRWGLCQGQHICLNDYAGDLR